MQKGTSAVPTNSMECTFFGLLIWSSAAYTAGERRAQDAGVGEATAGERPTSATSSKAFSPDVYKAVAAITTVATSCFNLWMSYNVLCCY